MQRKVIKSVGDKNTMIMFVESSTFFQRLFKKSVSVTKYVGNGGAWYILPSYTRVPTENALWLMGESKKILHTAHTI